MGFEVGGLESYEIDTKPKARSVFGISCCATPLLGPHLQGVHQYISLFGKLKRRLVGSPASVTFWCWAMRQFLLML